MKLYRIDEEAPDGGYASHFTIRAAIEWELLVKVEKCVHGKYDAHWPSTPCHCKLNDAGVKGVLVSSFDSPDRLRWQKCSHESWCLGAGLEDTK